MDLAQIIEMGQRTIYLALIVSAPILVTGLVVGVVISLLQAVTQVQEQTLSFVPKIIAMAVVMALILPWLTGQMVEYTQQLYAEFIAVTP